MSVYNEKCFTNYVEKVKDVKREEESEDVSHSSIQGSGQINYNESINESEMSTF